VCARRPALLLRDITQALLDVFTLCVRARMRREERAVRHTAAAALTHTPPHRIAAVPVRSSKDAAATVCSLMHTNPDKIRCARRACCRRVRVALSSHFTHAHPHTAFRLFPIGFRPRRIGEAIHAGDMLTQVNVAEARAHARVRVPSHIRSLGR
jgi:hypothetical protein